MPQDTAPQEQQLGAEATKSEQGDQGGSADEAERPEFRAHIVKSKQAASTPFTADAKVWLNGGGMDYALVVTQTRKNRETKEMMYKLKYKDGEEYNGGEWVMHSKLAAR